MSAVGFPTCDAVATPDGEPCGERGAESWACEVEGCGVESWACGPEHAASAQAGLDGHRLLAHPDLVPDLVRALARDPWQRAKITRHARQRPAQFAKLLAAVQAAG